MRSSAALFTATTVVLCGAYFSPLAKDQTVSLVLVDARNNQPIAGVVRIRRTDSGSELVHPPELLARGVGIENDAPINQWCVVPGRVRVRLPAAKLRIDAIAGLETQRATVTVDLARPGNNAIEIPLHRFSALKRQGWYNANTHLHLQKISRAQADRYLREIPAADHLDVLFISYLERAGDDQGYVTNQYPVGRLRELEGRGVMIAGGEEHRHNFDSYNQGYGHVMLLGIQKLVQPVSIGYGISKRHPDAPAIQRGIDTAHDQNGTAIWCHNNWGLEDVPNWVAGKLDAQNIFDGGSHGSYEESFYHYLNAGLQVPFSTGTDWFLYDFARAYARVDGDLTPASWLDSLRSGRTFITNGPLLELKVASAGIGDSVEFDGPGTVPVQARARGRLDFGRLELLRNGQVIEPVRARRVGQHFEAVLETELRVDGPCWVAVRVVGGGKTEYGKQLFAHSSPVYIQVAGRSVQIAQDLRYLVREMQSARSIIATHGHFDNDTQRREVLGIYDRGIEELRARLRSL